MVIRKIKEKVGKCPKCGSEHTVNHGDVTTVKHGIRARGKCQKCGHTFYIEER